MPLHHNSCCRPSAPFHTQRTQHAERPFWRDLTQDPAVSAAPVAHTLNQVERVCTQLHQQGHTVTFAAVADLTGLGRSTLYRDPTIRAVIDQHRHRSTNTGTITGLTDQIATLDALADKVRRHDEQLRRLTTPKN
ncbi:MAG: helix-turn-helix domain-containing protein [Microlunatus sp.]|nr:helix-turn-helix domain-containing protein [Microlunatus sp.]